MDIRFCIQSLPAVYVQVKGRIYGLLQLLQ